MLRLPRRPVSRARAAEAMRYAVVSGMSAIVTLGLPILLHEFAGTDPRIAVGIAFAVAFVMNFLTTRYFVFRSADSFWSSFRKFLLSSLMFRGAEYLGFLGLFALGLPYYVAQAIVVGLSFVLKFLALKHFVFKGRVAPDSIA